MKAQVLLKSLYKGLVIPTNLVVTGVKPSQSLDFDSGWNECNDCINCDGDCAC